MGFRTNSFATIWEIKPSSDTLTRARISISRKNKQTGEYETDFSSYVAFVGTAAAHKALSLEERDRIRLEDIDVSTKYDKEKGVTYTNYKIFSFSTQEEIDGPSKADETDFGTPIGDGDIDDSNLPF